MSTSTSLFFFSLYIDFFCFSTDDAFLFRIQTFWTKQDYTLTHVCFVLSTEPDKEGRQASEESHRTPDQTDQHFRLQIDSQNSPKTKPAVNGPSHFKICLYSRYQQTKNFFFHSVYFCQSIIR